MGQPMPELFDLSTSALLAFKRAIDTTGNNIANVNTEGYSRQDTSLASRAGQLDANFYVGSGVTVQSIERAYDQFLVGAVRTQTSSHSSYDSFNQIALRVDGLMSDSGQGIDDAMNQFFNAWQSLSNNPSGSAERTTLLEQSESLVQRFRSLGEGLSTISSEINQRVESGISDINRLAERIAGLNNKIVSASSGTTGQPNTLLDQRDLAIGELAQLVSVSVTPQGDGSVNISVGKGQALVVGANFSQLETRTDEFRPDLVEVGYAGSSGDISELLNGGELGGLLNVRQDLIEPARQKLGLLATGLASLVNDQHSMGLDLNSDLGGNFFDLPSLDANPSSLNSGSAEISVSQLTSADLDLTSAILSFDGTDWTVLDLESGISTTETFPFTYQGLELQLSGTAVAGDRFILQPYADAAASFDLAIDNTDKIAVAEPLSAILGTLNLGSAEIADVNISDASILPIATINLQYDPDALGVGLPGFHVTGAFTTTLAYDSANPSISISGIDIEFSGEPLDGDTFQIVASGVSGDNRNALNMAALQQEKLLLGGSLSTMDFYGNLVSEVASQTRQSGLNLEAEAALLEQSQVSQAAVSGVNLDEEAARLVQLQQAYQAAAQMITVADELFQSLIVAISR
jgi:flagellar hook-associated protein 1